MIKTILFLLCGFFCISCFAAEFPKPLSLSELIDIAMVNNPQTRIAWQNAKRAGSALWVAKSANYPSIELESLVKNGRNFKFINGPDTSYTIIGIDLVVSMMLFDFGERKADIESAKYALIAAGMYANSILQKVMLDVLENAYSLMHLDRLLEATYLSLEDAEIMMNFASQLSAAGLVPVTDVYTSTATLAQMKMDAEKQKGLRDIQKGKLIASLGISPKSCLQIAQPDMAQPILKQNIDQLIELSGKYRTDLLAKQAELSESLAKQNKVKASFRPKVAFTATGGANHALHDKSKGCQYQALLKLSVPLFDGFNNFYRKRMAYDEVQITKEELAELQLDIALDVLTYSVSLESAQQMLVYAEENLNNSIKAYEGVLLRYQAGKERITEVSNAQRQLVSARIRYSEILTQLRVSAANLAYSTGTFLR